MKLDTLAAADTAVESILICQRLLDEAIKHAIEADAPRIVARLKAQRKAVAGAVNHASHRAQRAMAGQPMRRRGYKE